MNNFFNQQQNNNPANAYYPEALHFDDGNKTSEQAVHTQDFSQQNQNNSNQMNSQGLENIFKLLKSNSNGDMLTSLLASGMFGGGQNNMMMQVLTQMMNSQKKPSTSEKKESTLNFDTSIEEL